MPVSLCIRFWEKVDKRGPDECWPWLAGRIGNGYGGFRLTTSRRTTAHRVALMLSGVEVPPELHVLHSCNNPPCCNPRHLRVGTPADNANDRSIAGHTASGERNAQSKITIAQAIDIRASVGELQRVVAARHGITQAQVSHIRNRKSWACAR